jgi:hypothetical protein
MRCDRLRNLAGWETAGAKTRPVLRINGTTEAVSSKADPKADPTAYGDFFLQHIWERAQFYDSLPFPDLRRTVFLPQSAGRISVR